VTNKLGICITKTSYQTLGTSAAAAAPAFESYYFEPSLSAAGVLEGFTAITRGPMFFYVELTHQQVRKWVLLLATGISVRMLN